MTTRPRPLALLLAIGLAACSSDGGGQSGLVQLVEDCPGALPCAVDVPHGYVATPSTVESTVRGVVAVGCGRFHGDCAYLCDSPWYICAPDAATCTAETTRDYLEDYDHPVADPTLAAQCRADIRVAACADIPPDTPACDFALVEGCPGDLDNLGAPYSWIAAAGLSATPVELQVHLCDGVAEWLSLDLQRGQTVRFSAREAEPSFGHVRLALHIHVPTHDAPDQLASERMAWQGDEPEELGPVDQDGRYLLELSLSSAPTADLTLTVEVVGP